MTGPFGTPLGPYKPAPNQATLKDDFCSLYKVKVPYKVKNKREKTHIN